MNQNLKIECKTSVKCMPKIARLPSVHISHNIKGYSTAAIILQIFWRNNLPWDFIKLGSAKCNKFDGDFQQFPIIVTMGLVCTIRYSS